MIETVSDKFQYERLTVDSNKTINGWYSDEDGHVSFNRIDELKQIQTALKSIGIDVSLKEGEYCWCSYCTDVFYANWIHYTSSTEDKAEFGNYAKTYFQIEVNKND